MSMAEVHAFTDKITASIVRQSAELGRPITCRGAGCFGCCNEPTMISRSEAQYIVAGLTPAQIEEIKPRLRRWVAQVTSSGMLSEKVPLSFYWRQLKAWCPLLADGRCTAYERRPFSCRSHITYGNPDDCFDDKRRQHQVYAIAPEAQLQTAAVEMEEMGMVIEIDHLGVYLAEMILGKKLKSAARWTVRGKIEGNDLVADVSELPERRNELQAK